MQLPLAIDLEALFDLIEKNHFEFMVWLCTISGMLGFGLLMAAIAHFRRSPVERIVHKRFG